MLNFWGKFSISSPGPTYVELMKLTEKMICPVPEKDEGAVGWAGKNSRSLLLLGSAIDSLLQRYFETGYYSAVSVYAGSYDKSIKLLLPLFPGFPTADIYCVPNFDTPRDVP